MAAHACGSESSSIEPAPVSDAGPPAEDAGAAIDSPPPPPPFDASLPEPLLTLSQTGLFSDLAAKAIATNAVEFAPAAPLWSDAADKKRWIVLPPGTRIDTSDMDHWQFPIGTRFFKEFAHGAKRLETRLLVRRAVTGNAETDFWAGSFVWRDDESDADLAPVGKENIRGTNHDAPSQTRCFACHVGEPGRILGFSALQLSKGPNATGTTMLTLAAAGLLTHPSAPGTDKPFPAFTSAAGAAAAYLHANCGHCHNSAGTAWPDTQMILRLGVDEPDIASSALAKTSIGIPLNRWTKPTYTLRIAPGSPSASGLLFRMAARGDKDQLPPIATEHSDPTGLATLTTWIQSL